MPTCLPSCKQNVAATKNPPRREGGQNGAAAPETEKGAPQQRASSTPKTELYRLFSCFGGSLFRGVASGVISRIRGFFGVIGSFFSHAFVGHGVLGHRLDVFGLSFLGGFFGAATSSQSQSGSRREGGVSNLLHENPLALFGAGANAQAGLHRIVYTSDPANANAKKITANRQESLGLQTYKEIFI